MGKKMIVLQICAYMAQYGGNYIASLEKLEAELREKGVTTQYAFPAKAKEYDWCKTIMRRTKVSFLDINRFSIKTYFMIKKAMREADIVHCHFELYDMLAAMAKNSDQKLFWHLHDSFDDHIDLAHRIINRVHYGIFGKKAILISPSRYYADYVVDLGFPRDSVVILENCIVTERLHMDKTQHIQYDFLTYGGFYHIKGLDIILESCRRLVRSGYHFTIAVIGYDATWEFIHNNFPELTAVVAELSPSEDVSRFYNMSETFICASRRENFSYAVLEACYMGKRIICSDIQGAQWAKKFPTVTFFPSEDPAALAQLMEKAIQERFTDDGSFEVVRERIRKEYNGNRWADTIVSTYQIQ